MILSACSESSSLTSFSKRKYLKKVPNQKSVEQVYEEPIVYANVELENSNYALNQISEIDENVEVNLNVLNKTKKNYTTAYSVKNIANISQKTPEIIEVPEPKKKIHPLVI